MKILAHRCTLINPNFHSNTATHQTLSKQHPHPVFFLSPSSWLSRCIYNLHCPPRLFFLVSIIFLCRQNEGLFPPSHLHCCCLRWWDQLLLQLSQPPCSFPLHLAFLDVHSYHFQCDWGKRRGEGHTERDNDDRKLKRRQTEKWIKGRKFMYPRDYSAGCFCAFISTWTHETELKWNI